MLHSIGSSTESLKPVNLNPKAKMGGIFTIGFQTNQRFRLEAFGGFSEGLFRRLDVPIWFHGGNGPDLIRRYDPQRGECPTAPSSACTVISDQVK